MKIVPITQAKAKQFIGRFHRHNFASITAVFVLGLENDEGELIGSAMVGRPKARLLDDGKTLEVTRVCVLEGNRNANSMMYGTCARVAKELGYEKIITYTLQYESGASLKGAGWQLDDGLYGGGSWVRKKREIGRGEYDLFGHERLPQGQKLRWRKYLLTRGGRIK